MTKLQAIGLGLLLGAIAWTLTDIAIAMQRMALYSRDARLDLRQLAANLDAIKADAIKQAQKKGAAASHAEVPPER